ncbi:metal-dependent hydrolase [Halobacteriales archaeon QS_5_68_33]|nr:MAG: metal-dependent hydrolase [Halobacteriales archaeon QS_5_68_33]
MVKLMGHLGMALLWSLPVWFVWEWRVNLAFIGFALSTSMLPDVDLVLRDFLPVVHHGITHTVVFVVATGLVVGAVVEFGLRRWLDRAWFGQRGLAVSQWALFTFIAGGLVLGGFSHLFADMLSAPDIAAPVEPFWPVFDKPWSVDLIYYSAFAWNVGLLAVGILAHLAFAAVHLQFGEPRDFTQRL